MEISVTIKQEVVLLLRTIVQCEVLVETKVALIFGYAEKQNGIINIKHFSFAPLQNN